MKIAYINGEFIPLSKARVSVMDRGFLLGDGVYDIFPSFDGMLFHFKHHFQRLQRSLEAIQLNWPTTAHEVEAILHQLIQKNDGGNLALYWQITRGVDFERQLLFSPHSEPTVFAYAKPFQVPSLAKLSQGIRTMTLTDKRWHGCDTKAITLLANVLLRNEAASHGMEEAILIRNDEAQEGTNCNLFIVTPQGLQTPPLSNNLLGGLTRELIIQLAKQHGMPLNIAPIRRDALYDAQEVWLSGTTREISPVIEIDGKSINNSEAGPAWWQMMAWLRQYREDYFTHNNALSL